MSAAPLRLVRWLWPGWWLYSWYIRRFVRHDCEVNKVICRTDWIMRFGPIGRWLDV